MSNLKKVLIILAAMAFLAIFGEQVADIIESLGEIFTGLVSIGSGLFFIGFIIWFIYGIFNPKATASDAREAQTYVSPGMNRDYVKQTASFFYNITIVVSIIALPFLLAAYYDVNFILGSLISFGLLKIVPTIKMGNVKLDSKK